VQRTLPSGPKTMRGRARTWLLVLAGESTHDGVQGRNCGARRRPPGPASAIRLPATQFSRERRREHVGSALVRVASQSADRRRSINDAGGES
jgi:hypothetical protein